MALEVQEMPLAFQAINRLLNGRLRHVLARGLAAGRSFTDLAFDLKTATGLTVSHETIRSWCMKLDLLAQPTKEVNHVAKSDRAGTDPQ